MEIVHIKHGLKKTEIANKRSFNGENNMNYERYYIDLFEMLNSLCKKIASGKYSQADTDRLFDLATKHKYPGLLADLAESFGMMMVKVEAREFQLKQTIEELEKAKTETK